jgi:putative hydrolase of the HAD superfamily
MLPDRRAVVFDMDDTLYPYRRFVLSGFVAVAAYLEDWHGVDAGRSFRFLARASRREHRGRELQAILEGCGLPSGLLPLLRRLLETHRPALRLPPVTRRILTALRDDGWRLGVLTNGPASRQARRVDVLGLTQDVDAVVFATDYGSGRGKPELAPFAEVCRRLAVAPSAVVFVGDDEEADIAGARAAGMRAVRCDAWTRRRPPSAAHAVLTRLPDLPVLARTLLLEESTRHVA